VKCGLLSTSALIVVQTASTSVLYTQTSWRTQDLHINVVILAFVTTSILLMSALCSILFGLRYREEESVRDSEWFNFWMNRD